MLPKKRTIVLSVQDLLKLKKGDFTWRHVPDAEIDCSEIPEVTPKQARGFKRLGKPLMALPKKVRKKK